MDSFYLGLGKFVFWSTVSLVGLVAVFCVGVFLWKKFIRYFWYMIRKVVFPVGEFFIEDWQKTASNAPTDSWRHYVKIFRKGRWFMWYSPQTKNVLNRVVFGRVKNFKQKK